MANDFLGQILSSVLSGGASRQHGDPLGGAGTGLGAGASMGGLGDLLGAGRSDPGGGLGGLGGLLGGALGAGQQTRGTAGSPYANKSALLAILLPLAMQWVQRNGGVGALLERFKDKGYGQQASSWVSTGQNEAVPAHAIDEVVGSDELSRLSQQLGMNKDEVSGGLAEILPEMVNQLSPQGDVVPDANDRLGGGVASLERLLAQFQRG
jgi:uncharacterized protein YidB (DUF937 family)